MSLAANCGGTLLGYGAKSAVAMLVKVARRLVPIAVAAAMITTEINEPMRPYSMAVTPDSSPAKRTRRTLIIAIPSLRYWAFSHIPTI
jgi:hypothetical protein